MNNNLSTVSPLPKPPDPPGTSFKEVLLNKERDLNQSYGQMEKIHIIDAEQPGGPIILSEEDKKRIYNPWKFSVIVKLFGKNILA
ncbi:hypothetical protein KY290_036582 [Solanum tuberosum]|uniref:Uncharacterized protein n=1 Tax=Solanum tuberosum TaxID=4113 RepID=A0ABQ7TT44_SOLTU|nr:hypothetical protein KY289_036072 [Solanum tuberosum]KAH0639318.1 hypothetical protein KY285_035904 [Solanum tuberosum]KAH0737877.1 hypothetical protein KY290_036582 [Solanum tuberosum]